MTNSILIIFLLLSSFHALSQQEVPKSVLFVPPPDVTPLDTFLESQIIKTALKHIISTNKFNIIVGPTDRKIFLNVDAFILRMQVRRDRASYEIILALHELRKNKIIKNKTRIGIPQDKVYFTADKLLQELFFDTELTVGRKISERKERIINRREKKGGVSIKENILAADFQSNVRVVGKSNRTYNNKKLNKRKKYFRNRIKREEDVEPSLEVVNKSAKKEQPSINQKSNPLIAQENEPVNPVNKKKARRPIFFYVGGLIESTEMTTSDLLPNVGNSNIRYGLELGYKVLRRGKFTLRSHLKLLQYQDDAVYNSASLALPVKYEAEAIFNYRFLPHLSGNFGLNYENLPFVNFRQVFNGLEQGELKVLWLKFQIGTHFIFLKKLSTIKAGFAVPVLSRFSYGNLGSSEQSSGSQLELSYSLKLTKKIELGLRYRSAQLDTKNINFSAQERSIGLYTRFRFSF